MRPPGRSSLAVVALVLLATGSIGLKALAGPPRDGANGEQIDRELIRRLKAQGFGVTFRPPRMQSGVVTGTRGSCRLTVRHALDGTADAIVFARDAAGVGPLRYLFDGRGYATLPAFRFRVARVRTEFANRLGITALLPIPVALATSSACNGGSFGLENIRVGT